MGGDEEDGAQGGRGGIELAALIPQNDTTPCGRQATLPRCTPPSAFPGPMHVCLYSAISVAAFSLYLTTSSSIMSNTQAEGTQWTDRFFHPSAQSQPPATN